MKKDIDLCPKIWTVDLELNTKLFKQSGQF